MGFGFFGFWDGFEIGFKWFDVWGFVKNVDGVFVRRRFGLGFFIFKIWDRVGFRINRIMWEVYDIVIK